MSGLYSVLFKNTLSLRCPHKDKVPHKIVPMSTPTQEHKHMAKKYIQRSTPWRNSRNRVVGSWSGSGWQESLAAGQEFLSGEITGQVQWFPK